MWPRPRAMQRHAADTADGLETYLSTNGAQPDWYMGWLIGALRIVPGFDVTIGDYTLIPNPFWGGILFPAVVFAFLYLWPVIERRVTRDHQLPPSAHAAT